MQYTHGITHREATAHVANKTVPLKTEESITPSREEPKKETNEKTFTPQFKNAGDFVRFCRELTKLGSLKDEEERNVEIGKKILTYVINTSKTNKIVQTPKKTNQGKPSQAERAPETELNDMPPPSTPNSKEGRRSRSQSRPAVKRNIDSVVSEEEDNSLRHGTNPMITDIEPINQDKRKCSVSNNEDTL
ncbi:hypothetical protein SNE40_001744 [Patella caerulea]|uniref:Uncharacterized protein n=1 Tax=Patella caerulea TaxID=87958 RepID=A0AAN8K5C4_PATCE